MAEKKSKAPTTLKEKQRQFIADLLKKKVARAEIAKKLEVRFKLKPSYARLFVYREFPMGSESHRKRSLMRKVFKKLKTAKGKAPSKKTAKKAPSHAQRPAKPSPIKKPAPKKAPAVKKPAKAPQSKLVAPKGLLAKATKVNAEKPKPSKSFLDAAMAEAGKPKPVTKPAPAASADGIEYRPNGG